MTALKLGVQDPHSDVSSAALLALGETCAVLEVNIYYLIKKSLLKKD